MNLWLFSSLRASSPFGDILKSRRAIGTLVIARSRAACFARPIGELARTLVVYGPVIILICSGDGADHLNSK